MQLNILKSRPQNNFVSFLNQNTVLLFQLILEFKYLGHTLLISRKIYVGWHIKLFRLENNL